MGLSDFKKLVTENLQAMLYRTIFTVPDSELVDKAKANAGAFLSSLKQQGAVKEFDVSIFNEPSKLWGSAKVTVNDTIPEFTVEFALDVGILPEKS